MFNDDLLERLNPKHGGLDYTRQLCAQDRRKKVLRVSRQSESRQSLPIEQRKRAYLKLKQSHALREDGEQFANCSRWDLYTVVNGQREYHCRGEVLAVVVAFACRNNLQIIDQNDDLGSIAEVMRRI